eukprot:c39473_g1_i1 orf=36-227(+)
MAHTYRHALPGRWYAPVHVELHPSSFGHSVFLALAFFEDDIHDGMEKRCCNVLFFLFFNTRCC